MRALCTMVLAVAALGVLSPAMAQNAGHPPTETERRPATRISASEAAQRALRKSGGGRVLDVRPEPDGYRVVVENRGEVRVVRVPGYDS